MNVSEFGRKVSKAAVYPFGWSGFTGSIKSVKTDAPLLALTFDDGPDPSSTPRLLDLLKKYSIKASFFVVGEAAEVHRAIIERMAEEGHAICNHGWSHRSLPLLKNKEASLEIERCSKVIEPFGTRLFRPPYGHQTPRTRYIAQLKAHQVVGWSGHVADWRLQSVDALKEKLEAQLHPGAIILMHDAIRVGCGVIPSPELQFDREPLLTALDLVLEHRHQDFEFVTLTELLQRGEASYQNWFHYNKEAL